MPRGATSEFADKRGGAPPRGKDTYFLLTLIFITVIEINQSNLLGLLCKAHELRISKLETPVYGNLHQPRTHLSTLLEDE